MTYTIVLLRENDGRYSVSVPALKGCHTWGETLPEALRMAEEAIQLHLESLESHGDPLPPDVQTVAFDLQDATEAMVYKVSIGERATVA